MTTTNSCDGRKARILAIHRYYWPDTPPYASILRSIAERWARDGHKVEVLTTQPSYKSQLKLSRRPSSETINNVRVRRIPLFHEAGRIVGFRIINMMILCFAVFVHAVVRRRRFDIIMVSTAPPVVLGAAARISAKLTGARFIYHCMDIHPEIGKISGEFRNRKLFDYLLSVDSKNCSDADLVIVLSEDMKKAIMSRHGLGKVNIKVINNFNLPDYEEVIPEALPEEYKKRTGMFRVLFAGNIGRFQGLEFVIDAFLSLSDRTDIELVLVGDGKAVEKLKARAGRGAHIRFIPHQSLAITRQIMKESDLCLVSLVPGIYKYAYPSKTMTYLNEGCPLLVSVESDSVISHFVEENKLGFVVPQNNQELIADIVRKAAQSPVAMKKMSQRAFDVSGRVFDPEIILDKWSSLARDLLSDIK